MRPFVVRGRGEFPRDMLRYDDCMFATHADEKAAGEGYVQGERRVTLLTQKREPTLARWESFGWRVVTFGADATQEPPPPSGYAATVAQHDKLLAEFAAYKEGSEEAFGAVVDAKQALERRVPQFESTIATQQRVIVDFRTQRDELLQALQGCALTMQALGVPVDAETRAAIAKATGRAA